MTVVDAINVMGTPIEGVPGVVGPTLLLGVVDGVPEPDEDVAATCAFHLVSLNLMEYCIMSL